MGFFKDLFGTQGEVKDNLQHEVETLQQLKKQSNRKPVSPKKRHSTVKIVVRKNTDAEDKIRDLNKEATQLSKNKEWDEAIECLEESQKLSLKIHVEYPIKHYLRLPLFLQQAGRFDESRVEFKRLIASTKRRMHRKPKHYGEAAWEASMHAELAAIYDKMRLACKREKLLPDAAVCAEKSVEHNIAWKDLQLLVEQER